MNFYKRALHLFSGLLLVSAPLASFAHTCGEEMGPIALNQEVRRTLRITDGLLEFAAEDAPTDRLLRATAKVLDALDDWNLEDISPWLGGDGPAYIDDRLRGTEFFREFPNALTVEAAKNFFGLIEFARAYEMNDYELGLMASLFPGVKHKQMPQLQTIHVQEPGWANKLNQEIRAAMKHERFRRAAALWLSRAEIRAHIIKSMNSVLIPMGHSVAEPVLLETLKRIRANAKLTDEDDSVLFTLYSSILDQVMTFGQAIGHQPFDIDAAKGFYLIERHGFLDLVERHHLEYMRLEVGRSDFLSFVDHIYFGQAAPLPVKRLREMMYQEIARFLMPAKGRFSRHQSLQQKESDRRLTERMRETVPKTIIQLYDAFPLPPPSKKRCAYVDAGNGELVKAECRQPIPESLDLRRFASEAKSPRPIEELEEQMVYVVDFKRYNETGQKVQIGPKALHWFRKHPEGAREVLDAIFYGRARLEGQNGIKIYYRNRPTDYRIFEVKTGSTIRGMMMQVDGVYQLIDVVYKDELKRAVENLAPL